MGWWQRWWPFGRARRSPGPPPEPAPDEAFLGSHGAWIEVVGTPQVGHDFLGLVLAGPRRVSCAEAMSAEPWHQRQVPAFVVCGHYSLSAEQLRALGDDPSRLLALQMSGSAFDGEVCKRVGTLVDEYEYEVVGIHRTPAPEPPWRGPPDGGMGQMVAMGGYFNVPLGLYVGELEPGEVGWIEVTAVCGVHRSEVVRIEVVA